MASSSIRAQSNQVIIPISVQDNQNHRAPQRNKIQQPPSSQFKTRGPQALQLTLLVVLKIPHTEWCKNRIQPDEKNQTKTRDHRRGKEIIVPMSSKNPLNPETNHPREAIESKGNISQF